MIRQICPHCAAAVELPDSAAGATNDCPACRKPFAVPAGYVPSVAPPDLPPPPPGFVPPKPPGAVSAPVPVAAPGEVPVWAEWAPAVGLTLALLATFFPWVGSYPGDIRVYGQSAWQAAVGTFSTAILPDGLTDDEPALRAAVGFSGWVLAFLPLLLVAVAAAWAERLVPDDTLRHPPGKLAALGRLAPHRRELLAGLTAGLVLLLLLQNVRGYGLERAAVTVAEAKYADELKAAADSQNKLTRAQVKVGFEVNRLGVEPTFARRLAAVAVIVAAGGAAAGWWAGRRRA